MPEIEMICLANSRKRQGRCIAGLRTDGQGWLRPVAPGEEGTLSPHQLRMQSGGEPRLLDIIKVGCACPQPRPHQPENWLLDDTRWQLISREPPHAWRPSSIFESEIDSGPAIFGSVSDRRCFDDFAHAPARSSLALVAPEDLRWQITLTHNFNRQTRALFHLQGACYNLSVTDPVWEQRLSHLPDGHHDLAASGVSDTDLVHLTVSLSEPFNGYCYKLVAAVIVLPQS